MSRTEQIFIFVLTLLGFLAGFANDSTLPEKVFLVIAPLLMWYGWRRLIKQLR